MNDDRKKAALPARRAVMATRHIRCYTDAVADFFPAIASSRRALRLAVLVVALSSASALAEGEPRPWHVEAGVKVTLQNGVNFDGGDLAHFTVRGDRMDACARLCARARLCVGFTVARGAAVDGSHDCFLKRALTGRRDQDCCDSALVDRR
jgi:hypothetical protein